MPGSWTSLDLSLAEIFVNPDSTPMGQYNSGTGTIRPYIYGGGYNLYFAHPDLRFNTMDPNKAWEIEITYDADAQYTYAAIYATPLPTFDSYWYGGANYVIGSVGGYNSTGVPGPLSTPVGPGATYGSYWVQAVNGGYQGLVFACTNRTVISAIRYRLLTDPLAAITGAGVLNLNGDLNLAYAPGIHAKYAFSAVGIGDILHDGSDDTYYVLNGFKNGSGTDHENAGWVLVDIPAKPDYGSLISLTVTLRHEYYALTGSPTQATPRIFLADKSRSDVTYPSIEYPAYRALCLPSYSYPAYPIPTGVREDTYVWQVSGTQDFKGQYSGNVSSDIKAAIIAGNLQIGLAPQRYYADGFDTTQVQGKLYEISYGLVYAPYIPPVFDPPPDLPDGYTDWTELDLSTAVFLTNFYGTPYGQYDPANGGRILTNTGWPDFYFPGFTLDPDLDYYILVVFDLSDERHSVGWEDVYVAGIDPADPQNDYYNGTYNDLYNDDNWVSGNAYHLFQIGAPYSSDWDAVGAGHNMPYFDTGRYGVVAKIYWASSAGGPPPEPPPFVDEHQRSTPRFWGQ